MKVVEIRDSFGADSLQLVERPEPVPAPGQVLLKMKAFSINYRDLLLVNGVGRWKPPLGRVPVSDGVGIVVEAGTGVSRVKIGDRISPIFYLNGWKARPQPRRWWALWAAQPRTACSRNTQFVMK